jgi:hypothetical protein
MYNSRAIIITTGTINIHAAKCGIRLGKI